MKTAATNKKIKELIVSLREKKLITKPDFQRRLVWSTEDKNNFIDTVLKNFPFPEIFLADTEVDLQTGDSLKVIVDGQQRITTLYDYFTNSPYLKLKDGVPAYSKLDRNSQKSFLDYDVAVRDLGSATREEIIEVFQRINATSYPLNPMELNNAIYEGALKHFAEKISNWMFFESHRLFTAQDFRRMGDVRYLLSVIATMLSGYFNRDDELESLLQKFNDEFPYETDIENRLLSATNYIEKYSFEKECRIWKKVDFFTAIIEIDNISEGERPNVNESRSRIKDFYSKVDLASKGEITGSANEYYLAAVQGTNNKANRVTRGRIFRSVILG